MSRSNEESFLSFVVDKIKLLEYRGCTCGIDKQEIYEELWQVLHDNYDKIKQAKEVSRSFSRCLSQTAALNEKQEYKDLLPWLKHMYHEMNDLEDEGLSMGINGRICATCSKLESLF